LDFAFLSKTARLGTTWPEYCQCQAQQTMGNRCGSGEAGVEVDQAPASIIVHVKNAQGLPEVDWFPGTDRFLYFGVGADAGGDELFKSQQKKNVLDPVWNEEFELPADMPVKFTIFQSDADGKVDQVACATLDLTSGDAAEFHGELALQVNGKATGGILTLKAKARHGDEYPPEQSSEYAASIDNAKKGALGLEVDKMDPANLYVIGVKKGTIMDRYNEEQIENKVAAGCFIVGVTGADIGSASDSQAMEKILKQNPKQVDLVCRRAKTFRIFVTMPKQGDMGLEVMKRGEGNSLLIKEIHSEGAVGAWNVDNPAQTVEPGDRIVAVNGKSGNAADLKNHVKEVRKAADAVLTIVRMAF